uniref:RING-type domain-containing protein n=1 Tax=Haplochromis burtoni TaxID=8153 RepID=A0A3Q2WF44_HAPBU
MWPTAMFNVLHLCCPVCLDIFKEPVLLPCSHSFCKDCLDSWWRENPAHDCPVCQKQSTMHDPPCNLALKNLCETFIEERNQITPEDLCSLHSEKLSLFCLDHQELVCVVCGTSDKHSDHKFKPIDKAAQQHKNDLQETVEALKQKLKVCEEVQVNFDQTAGHIKHGFCMCVRGLYWIANNNRNKVKSTWKSQTDDQQEIHFIYSGNFNIIESTLKQCRHHY